MTPEEKARELVEKYHDEFNMLWYISKKCALITVEEIIKSKDLNYLFTKEIIYSMEGTSDDRWIYETFMKYWEQVKKQIKNL